MRSLTRANKINDLRVVEGRVAQRYWEAVQSAIPETFDFRGRVTRSHQYNASDPVNLALNYAYGVLEGEARWAINSVGLEPSAGFLHDFARYQTKESLVYDMQEPFRWLCDVTVIEAVESRVLDLKDFYFTGDDYQYRIEICAKRRFLALLNETFNIGRSYGKGTYKWDNVIVPEGSGARPIPAGRIP
jgi:CRISPR-associated protein Cas1